MESREKKLNQAIKDMWLAAAQGLGEQYRMGTFTLDYDPDILKEAVIHVDTVIADTYLD